MSNIFLFIVFTSFIFALLLTRESQDLSKKIPQNSLGLNEEKLTHLHFYFHDIVSGRNPTIVQVASADITNTSSTYFAAIMMIDDPLTEGPERSSKQVGRAQGIYVSASLSELSISSTHSVTFQ
ncbi:Dirigent protein [Heracleum sosnowskyi]|uniref:Dirigent protein n=1 Tax=Heracleum sosnowskyi TaxID=360622 RepID=A0AAD8IIR3_9APIA|nr:Dirigent protein [Heracleum sosnowskyi]